MKLSKIIYIVVGVLVVLGIIALIFFKVYAPKAAKIQADNNELIRKAKVLFTTQSKIIKDMAVGPCLGFINDDYVVDVVNNPRTAVDDDPKNQCESYTLGQAKHFIELDTKGNFVRMK
jgi:hypothetical protein